MRVAYICADSGIPVCGTKGAAIHVQQIVRAFQRRGDDVTVYATRRGQAESRALRNTRIVEVPLERSDAAGRERATQRAAHRIADLIAADGYDLVYERLALFSDAAAQAELPRIVEVNAPLIEEQRQHRTLIDEAAALAAVHRQLSAADTVACVSDPVAAWARERGARHAVVTPNGVDTRAFIPATIDEEAFRAVFVGSLKPWHGVETAIDAISGVDNASLVIIGEGPERERLQAYAARTGSAVHWLGAMPHDRIPEILQSMHVGLAPYPAAAGDYFSPLKVYEYLAAGLPVIGSAVGQLPGIIDDTTGLLVPPDDDQALRTAIIALRDDRNRARQLGAAARERAVAHHDWDRTLDQILNARKVPV